MDERDATMRPDRSRRQTRPRSGLAAAVLSAGAAAGLTGFVAAVLWAALLACPFPAAAATEITPRTVTVPVSWAKPAPPRITSTAAILIDQHSGRILFSHNANARLPMASTTKIMTAVLVLENLKLNEKIKISANAVSTIGSKASLQRGEVLTVAQLLYALMVVSGNDASIALAEATAGSVEAFVQMMNEKAKELGLTNTHFVNPCGLNNKKHFSSAKDLAALARYALENRLFASIVDTIYFSLPPIAAVPPATKPTLRDFDNQNELLKRLSWVTGVKTGSTPYAKYCLVASGSMEGVSLVAVILGAQDDETRWKEAQSLLEYGVGLHPRTVLIGRGEMVAEVGLADYLGRQVQLVAARPLVARLSADDVVTGTATLDRPLVVPVHVGDVFGTMDFTLNGRSLGTVDLIASQPVERPTIRMILDHWKDLRPPLLRPVG